MRKLVAKLDKNGVVDEDDATWGALMVLAENNHQDNAPWNEFQFQLCVSFRNLNQAPSQFYFPIPLCDDAGEEIDT